MLLTKLRYTVARDKTDEEVDRSREGVQVGGGGGGLVERWTRRLTAAARPGVGGGGGLHASLALPRWHAYLVTYSP